MTQAKSLPRHDISDFRALARRVSGTSLIEISRNNHVYRSGIRDDHVYVVERGQVKTQMVAASGKRCLLSVYVVGDLFGESTLLGLERLETAIALTRTVLLRVPAARAAAVLAAEGSGDVLARHLSIRLRHQQQVVADMVTLPSELRLAVRLLDLAERFGRRGPGGTRVDIAFTQEDLSEMVGTTRTRIGQFLKRFRELEIVNFTPRSHLTVHEERLSSWISTATQ
ncbi:Crp/Fnr family transcriptional regulator [Micromonospora sp. NPDC047467]|uniref:Crp/Fnr family transcriptional regulator n=1 Tax=Micromonospora sp. NPDC047467 TaxID=3154814 RepID=UPI003409E61B